MPFVKGQSGNPARQFKPGQSGNPGGRPKRQKEAAKLAERYTPAILETLAERAQAGDVAAATAFLRFALPPPKARPAVDLGPLRTAEDVQAGFLEVARHIAAGELSPEEIASLLSVIRAAGEMVAGKELEAEIRAIKEHLGLS
jgi:hypothetical protein